MNSNLMPGLNQRPQSESFSATPSNCPACGSGPTVPVYQVENVPVHSVLLMRTREEAISYPRGFLSLHYCSACGFLFNAAFDPALMEYSSRYEETQGFSDTFQAFHRKLASSIAERHNLIDKTVLEIGCGKGEFLSLLCETTGAKGIGFDPSYLEERNVSAVKDRIEFVKDFYSESYVGYTGDLVCCKMTLEHIHDVAAFVRTSTRSMKPDGVLFYQVPNVMHVLHDLAFWDIYYEHCSYFSAGSLARLFRNSGLTPMQVGSDYNGQYLMIEGKTATSGPTARLPEEDDIAAVTHAVQLFRERIAERLAEWRRFLLDEHAHERKTVLWGGGSKAVAFLTTLGIQDEVQYAVDINPYKWNAYLPGSGQEVVSPDFLATYKPDNVIVMNPVYVREIGASLAELGLSPQMLACDLEGPRNQVLAFAATAATKVG
jgi:SAM-dependent methyltransferase